MKNPLNRLNNKIYNPTPLPYNRHERKQKPKKAATAMTVCIAALCNQKSIGICLSDMMVTDSLMSSRMVKMYNVKRADITIMIAGDIGTQMEIFQNIDREVSFQETGNPEKAWRVREIADIYAKYLKEEILNAQEDNLPNIAAIIIGFDSEGIGENYYADSIGHIYTIFNNNSNIIIENKDSTGYAFIGIGETVAKMQVLSILKHLAATEFSNTLLAIYLAKKRTEALDRVIGEDTHFHIIGPGLKPHMKKLNTPQKLKDIYDKILEKEREILNDASLEFQQFIGDDMDKIQ